MRYVDGIHSQPVIQPVRFGDRAVFIQQERIGHGMGLEKLCRVPHAPGLLRRDVHQFRSGLPDFNFHELYLSHALDAVRSPGTTQKFHDQGSAGQETRQ
jgi:hypothetical protein